jgi:hypothetical protein
MFNVPKLERKDTAPYEFPSLDPKKPIILHTRPLSMSTREVFNDAFTERPALPKAPTPYDDRAQIRAQNLDKLARCCVTRWENVTDDGEPLDCTPENVLKLLKFLDEEAGYREEITAYIAWSMNTLNFREPLVSPTELGKT